MAPVLMPLNANGGEREERTAVGRDGVHATAVARGLWRRLTTTAGPRPSFRLQGPRTGPPRLRVPTQTTGEGPGKPRPDEGACAPTTLGG